MTKFLKRVWRNYSKLGRRKKKNQTWRRPRGRDNKMREKRKSYPAVVKIGYGSKSAERKEIKVIQNLADLENAKKDEFLAIGKVGKKKKLEIVKMAKTKGIAFQNVNVEKFLKMQQKKTIEKKEVLVKQNESK